MGFISVSQDLDTGDLVGLPLKGSGNHIFTQYTIFCQTNSRSKTKRMTGTVLANHDLYLLEAWHTAMEEEIGEHDWLPDLSKTTNAFCRFPSQVDGFIS